MSRYAKRLERGKFICPSPADGVVVITPAQLAYMLEGIDWGHPQAWLAGMLAKINDQPYPQPR